MKKKLLLALSYVLVIALTLTATVAYFTDTDSAVNVMTVGNIDIMQIEQERIDSEKPAKDNLQKFTQDKLLLPAYFEGSSIPWADTSIEDWKVVQSHGNVIDKFVTVKNTGKNPAYVRTLIAYEGDAEYGPNGPWIHVVHNGSNVADKITERFVGYTTVEGVEYTVFEYLYLEPLAPGETTIPSLKQVYMNNKATMEVAEYYGEEYSILVLSQAIQSELGFDHVNPNAKAGSSAPTMTAEKALNAGFGAPEAPNAKEPAKTNMAVWFEGEDSVTDNFYWTGDVDTSWYNDTDTEFTLTEPEQIAGLAQLVDGGNDFEGKTVKLDRDVNLYHVDENGEPVSFEPIGSFSDDKAFKGVFDGQGHTVYNMYQNGWALANGYWDGPEYGMGFFSLVEDATVKNINFDDASLPTEANIIGVVAGGAGGNCVFENITVTNSYLGNHSWYSGGLIGWAEGDQKYINCDVDETNVVSSQWGDFNNANGGLIGGIDSNGTYYFEDCNVACVIDAYNDVTSAYEWYSYRNCGMLIGNTGTIDDPDGNNVGNATADNVTCKNVTVTYGDWANYHYCEFGSSGYPFCRVEAGESTGAYGNARVGEYFDANGNKVVDDNHTHNAGEKHNELIVFDQLYGGESGDRYCTYGTATHPGVTVIYNNK